MKFDYGLAVYLDHNYISMVNIVRKPLAQSTWTSHVSHTAQENKITLKENRGNRKKTKMSNVCPMRRTFSCHLTCTLHMILKIKPLKHLVVFQ